MAPYTSQYLGAFFGCLVCLLPLVAGFALGAWYTRKRLTSSSLLEALTPQWLTNWLRKY